MPSEILVCNSPIFNEKLDTIEKSLPPLGLGYIDTAIKKIRSVELLDAYNQNLSSAEAIDKIREIYPKTLVINVFSINKSVVFDILQNLPKDIDIICGGGIRGIDFSGLSLKR